MESSSYKDHFEGGHWPITIPVELSYFNQCDIFSWEDRYNVSFDLSEHWPITFLPQNDTCMIINIGHNLIDISTAWEVFYDIGIGTDVLTPETSNEGDPHVLNEWEIPWNATLLLNVFHHFYFFMYQNNPKKL